MWQLHRPTEESNFQYDTADVWSMIVWLYFIFWLYFYDMQAACDCDFNCIESPVLDKSDQILRYWRVCIKFWLLLVIIWFGILFITSLVWSSFCHRSPCIIMHCLLNPGYIILHLGIITFVLPLLTRGSPGDDARQIERFSALSQHRCNKRASTVLLAAVRPLRTGAEHVISENHVLTIKGGCTPTLSVVVDPDIGIFEGLRCDQVRSLFALCFPKARHRALLAHHQVHAGVWQTDGEKSGAESHPGREFNKSNVVVVVGALSTSILNVVGMNYDPLAVQENGTLVPCISPMHQSSIQRQRGFTQTFHHVSCCDSPLVTDQRRSTSSWISDQQLPGDFTQACILPTQDSTCTAAVLSRPPAH